MKTAAPALVAALALGLAAPAAAENGGTSLRAFNTERAKARAAGGYGNPFLAVPAALADMMGDAVTTLGVGEAAARRTGREGAATTTARP